MPIARGVGGRRRRVRHGGKRQERVLYLQRVRVSTGKKCKHTRPIRLISGCSASRRPGRRSSARSPARSARPAKRPTFASTARGPPPERAAHSGTRATRAPQALGGAGVRTYLVQPGDDHAVAQHVLPRHEREEHQRLLEGSPPFGGRKVKPERAAAVILLSLPQGGARLPRAAPLGTASGRMFRECVGFFGVHAHRALARNNPVSLTQHCRLRVRPNRARTA